MKVRNGFVSNSSSSSFICDVSGEVASGWDMCIEEADMYKCENGHTFLREYAVEFDYKEVYLQKMENIIEYHIKYEYDDIEDIKKVIDEIENNPDYDDYENLNGDFDLEMDYDYPSEGCPICQMKYIKIDDMLKYLLKKNNLTEEELKKEMKEKFDFQSMKKYINE